MAVIKRYEKGDKYLDVERYQAKSIDEDGCAVYDECWEVTIYGRKETPSQGQFVDFASEVLLQMFIDQNGWKEQVQ